MGTWHINYRGWRICHDPLGAIACYRLGEGPLEWCYFGRTVAEIKSEIDRREATAGLTAAYSRVATGAQFAEEGAKRCVCGSCGHLFASEIPLKDERGLSNDVACPECGAWDIYPDTAAGAAQSMRDQLSYEEEAEQ